MALAGAVWTATDDRNLGLIAAGVAFYGLFAVFPGMAAMILLWGFFADPAAVMATLDLAGELIPAEALALLKSQIGALVAANARAVGWAAAPPLMLALYAGYNGVAALLSGLSAIHGRPQRGGWLRLLVALAMTLALAAAVLGGLAAVIFVPVALAFLPLGPFGGWMLAALPWAVLFSFVLMTLGFFYRFGPNRPVGPHTRILPGAMLAATLWAAASLGFSLYLANFGTYNQIYGSIGAVAALLMWFYISAYTVLLGAAFNAELSRLGAAQ